MAATQEGRFVEGAFRPLGNPITYLGPGSLGLKTAVGALSGLGSEMAGEMAAGTQYEESARIAGSLLAPLAPTAFETTARTAQTMRAAQAARRAARMPFAGEIIPPDPSPPPPQQALEHSNIRIAELPHVDSLDVPLVHDATTALASAQRHGIDLDALLARAHEFHRAMNDDIAQGNRTTAVLLTDGPLIVGAGKQHDITPFQKRLLRDGEIEARRPGAIGER